MIGSYKLWIFKLFDLLSTYPLRGERVGAGGTPKAYNFYLGLQLIEQKIIKLFLDFPHTVHHYYLLSYVPYYILHITPFMVLIVYTQKISFLGQFSLTVQLYIMQGRYCYHIAHWHLSPLGGLKLHGMDITVKCCQTLKAKFS